MRCDDKDQSLVKAILDLVVPASADGRVPGAGSPDVVEYVIDAFKADASTTTLFEQAVALGIKLANDVGGELNTLSTPDRLAIVTQIEKREPEFFHLLLRHTYMGYYSRACIRPLFGLSQAPTQPDGYAVARESEQEIAALTQPVVSRGRCYREC